MGNSNSTPKDKYGCPAPTGSLDYNDVGTAWSGMRWTALASTGLTALVCLTLIMQHLRRYRAPKEQRQIIRIIFSIPLYSVIAFFEIYQYKNAQYIDPLGDLYEAFGLCALFLLFIQYAAPSGTFDEATFTTVKSQEESASSFAWPKIAWIFVFQYPIIETLSLIVEEATQVTHHYCSGSLSPKFAHIWVEIAMTISIGPCVVSILRFRGRMKGMMRTKRGLSKIVMFKAVVFLRFTQQWIFSILLETDAIKTSKQFTYNDILWGIPAVLTCVEMAFFAVAFWYAFSASEYSSTAHPGTPMPIWKAIAHALNPTDLILGMVRVVPLFLEVRSSGDWNLWQQARKQEKSNKRAQRGLRTLRDRRTRGAQYEGLPTINTPAPYKPTESYHLRTASNESYGDAGACGRMSPSYVYQPPAGSPPAHAGTHLMAEAQSPPRGAQWNGQTFEEYGRSRSPSPGRMHG